jgi:hypothetical protein
MMFPSYSVIALEMVVANCDLNPSCLLQAQQFAADNNQFHARVAADTATTAPPQTHELNPTPQPGGGKASGSTVLQNIKPTLTTRSQQQQLGPGSMQQQQQQQQHKAPQQQRPAAGAATNVTEELMKLKQLLDAGIITKEIFDRGKKKALGI